VKGDYMSREYTKEEIIDDLISHLKGITDY